MARRFLFTLNNPTQQDLATILGFVNNEQFRFLIYQGEISATGTPHLQGYVEIQKNQRISWFQANFSDRAHYETAKGSSEQNIHYCSKPTMLADNTPCACEHCVKARSLGRWLEPQQFGKPATDLLGSGMWESVQNMVIAGADNKIITDALPACIPHLKKIDEFRKMRDRTIKANKEIKDPVHEWRPIRGIWIYGPSGSGKSQAIWSEFPDLYSCAEKNPFDEYLGQKIVLFDDFSPKKLEFKTLLRYLDKYPVQLTCRYMNTWAMFTDFFITHIQSPLELYHKKSADDLMQLLRRIEIVKIHVNCAICNAEAIYADKQFYCAIHRQQTQFERHFLWKKQMYASFHELLQQIPYRK